LKEEELDGSRWRTRFGRDYESLIRLTNTGLFISPSGNSELDCATTKTDTTERSI